MPDTPRAALVLGGSRGIGAAAARRLAADGFAVALTYNANADAAEQVVTDIESGGGSAVAIEADSADADAIRAAVATAVDRFGDLSAVVVNAGILRRAALEDFSLEDLDLMLAVNVRGVFLAIQAASPHLVEGASVITIGSNVAKRGRATMSVYQLTKAAVSGLVRSLALELAPRGITVNNIEPGPFETDMNADRLEQLREASPSGRVGRVEELAALISYLASPDARYVTGTDVTIDGGFSL